MVTMNALPLAAAGAVALVLAGAAPAQTAPSISTRADAAIGCDWTREVAPDRVRSPVQMDVHAAYRIFALASDGTVGYRVRGEFPYAAFLSYTVYDGTLLHA